MNPGAHSGGCRGIRFALAPAGSAAVAPGAGGLSGLKIRKRRRKMFRKANEESRKLSVANEDAALVAEIFEAPPAGGRPLWLRNTPCWAMSALLHLLLILLLINVVREPEKKEKK